MRCSPSPAKMLVIERKISTEGNPKMAKATITRTVFTARAYAFVVDGIGDDGMPVITTTEAVEFASTAPSKSEGFKALKAAGIKCARNMVNVEVLHEKVYAMPLETFLSHAVPVERKRNGELQAQGTAE